MSSKLTTLFFAWTVLLVNAAAGQPVNSVSHALKVIEPSAPTIRIDASNSGALVRTLALGNSSLSLGKVSYFTGTSAPGHR